MNFNKERFANFAKYDLAINKVFYRNLGLVTAIGAVGIAVMGFVIRYSLWSNMTFGDDPANYDPYSEMGYNTVWMTSIYILSFLLIMMFIFAGCTFHNLRNKQGRITELTLPATNLEKFAWHTGLMVGGGLILCVLSLLLADGINALLTLVAYGAEGGVASITGTACNLLTLNFPELTGLPNITVNEEGIPIDDETNLVLQFVRSVGFSIVCMAIAEVAIYLFGNALKYKYNIILTYIAMQVLGFVFAIFLMVGIGVLANHADTIDSIDANAEDAFHFMTFCSYAFGTLSLLVAGFLGWWSYKKYARAQITSPLNK